MSRLAVLRALIGAMTVSTAIHYTHNFVDVQEYPGPHGAMNTVTRVLIVLTWPALTYLGILGYRRFAAGRFGEARAALLTYTVVGWVTLGHFAFGDPNIPAIPYATLFTDAALAAAITAFVLICVPRTPPRGQPGPPDRARTCRTDHY